jgi:hypothetical protein
MCSIVGVAYCRADEGVPSALAACTAATLVVTTDRERVCERGCARMCAACKECARVLIACSALPASRAGRGGV